MPTKLHSQSVNLLQSHQVYRWVLEREYFLKAWDWDPKEEQALGYLTLDLATIGSLSPNLKSDTKYSLANLQEKYSSKNNCKLAG